MDPNYGQTEISLSQKNIYKISYEIYSINEMSYVRKNILLILIIMILWQVYYIL